jgi:hypothetical protein
MWHNIEVYVLRKLQWGISATEMMCEHWNIKINEGKTQAIYFSHKLRSPWASSNIECMNHVKYLGDIFDKRIRWRLHIEMIKDKAFRTFIRIYSLFKSEHLSANIKQILHKALIRSVMTYAWPTWNQQQTPTS